MKLCHYNLDKFAEALASESPTPGGGSVSALAGCLSASLCVMVANLTVGREKYRGVWEDLARTKEEARRLSLRLLQLVDEDTEAYNKVADAFKLPKSTPEEIAARKQAIEAASREAALAPMDTLKALDELAGLVRTVIDKGNPSCITDGGVAAQLLRAAALGAAYNVRVNLPSIADEDFKASLEKEAHNVLERVKRISGELESLVDARMS